jgi:thiol-disulfide isomerase/thioredoxin
MLFKKLAVFALLPALLVMLLVFAHTSVASETKAPPTPAAVRAPGDTTGFDLLAYRGKVVYLDFWASWCAPCKQSFPWMRAMQERFASRGFEVVAVNLDRDPRAAREFLEKNAVPFRIIYDPQGDLARAYKVEAMPSSYLYDRAGRQRATHQGFKESERPALETQVFDLLAESAPDSTPR